MCLIFLVNAFIQIMLSNLFTFLQISQWRFEVFELQHMHVHHEQEGDGKAESTTEFLKLESVGMN